MTLIKILFLKLCLYYSNDMYCMKNIPYSFFNLCVCVFHSKIAHFSTIVHALGILFDLADINFHFV